MKQTINKVAIAGMFLLAFNACKKDTKDQPTLTTSGTTTLTSNYSSVIALDSANNNSGVVSFSWDSTKVGFRYAAVYTLEFDAPSDNFASPKTIVVTDATASVMGVDLDIIANSLKLSNGSANSLSVRLKVVLTQLGTGQGSEIVAPIYSNVITIMVNPYYIPVPLDYLEIPGAYQGWAPTSPTVPQLASEDGIHYQGFDRINASGGTFEFKFTSAPDWSHTNFGSSVTPTTAGNVTSGALSTTGSAGNLIVPAAGVYFFQVDTTTTSATYSATLINSFVANGTATGNTPVTLSYDSVANVWSATGVSLSAGTLDYIANPGATDGSMLTFGLGVQDQYHVALSSATSVTVATAGTYNIKLILGSPLNYVDSLIKQ